MDNIKQKNTIVSRETQEYYMWNVDDEIHRINCDINGNVILELTNPPVCHNYSYFEGTCTSECTWCDNPFHCKYKNVSRETFYTIPDIWHYINFCSAMVLCPLCCVECKTTTRTRCIMYDIAMDMIFETGVC